MIGRQNPNSHAELISPLGHVIEIRDPVRQLDWVVKGKQVAERTEPDALGPQQRLGDEQVGGRAGLPGRGEVFSDPGLLEAERVQPIQVMKIPELAVPDRPLRRVGRHQ